jgi:hypothetical protein
MTKMKDSEQKEQDEILAVLTRQLNAASDITTDRIEDGVQVLYTGAVLNVLLIGSYCVRNIFLLFEVSFPGLGKLRCLQFSPLWA